MNYDRRISPANSFTLISNLSDTQNIQLIDLSAQYTDDDMQNYNERGLMYCRGFHSNITGKIVIEPAGNIAGHSLTLEVTKGKNYVYSVRKFMSTGSDTFMANNLVAYR